MGHNLCLHFGVDEHPFATYVHVHQYTVLTHSHVFFWAVQVLSLPGAQLGHGDGVDGEGEGQDHQARHRHVADGVASVSTKKKNNRASGALRYSRSSRFERLR